MRKILGFILCLFLATPAMAGLEPFFLLESGTRFSVNDHHGVVTSGCTFRPTAADGTPTGNLAITVSERATYTFHGFSMECFEGELGYFTKRNAGVPVIITR